MTKNKILIVAGMHRSGTSLTTQWLNKCGLHVGDNLLGALTGNDDGHFEDLDFFESHKSLLKKQRLPHNGLTAKPVRPLTEEEKDTLRDIINYKNGFHQQWGWKDPRTCLFLDAYRQIIPQAYFFVVLRDYPAVISSLISRMYKLQQIKYEAKKGLSGFAWKHYFKARALESLKKKHVQHFLQIWIKYNEAILHVINQLPQEQYLVMSYHTLLENDKALYDHLVNDWGFSLNYYGFNQIYKDGKLGKPFDIEPYIHNKTLLQKADTLEKMLLQKIQPATKHHTLIAV
ncbi:MAG: sulfotransferase [Chitinophagaceae bacterium]